MTLESMPQSSASGRREPARQETRIWETCRVLGEKNVSIFVYLVFGEKNVSVVCV